MKPLLDEIKTLRVEVANLKESNCDLIRLLTNPKFDSHSAFDQVESGNSVQFIEICPLSLQHKSYASVVKNLEKLDLYKNGKQTTPANNSSANDFSKTTKSRRNRKTQEIIIGSANSSDDCAQKSKKAWLYIGRVQSNTPVEKTNDYITKRIPNIGKIIVEKLDSKDVNSSFKLDVDFSFKDTVSKDSF